MEFNLKQYVKGPNELSGSALPTEMMQKIVTSLEAHVSHLNASGCSLGQRSDIDELFTSIPNNIRTLSLSDNELTCLQPSHFQKFLRSLSKKNIETLNLSNNNLRSYSDSVLQGIFKHIPESVHTVILSKKDLRIRTEEEWAKFIEPLPPSIKSISIIDDDVLASRFKMKEEQAPKAQIDAELLVNQKEAENPVVQELPQNSEHSYHFQLHCFYALAGVSALMLLAGLIAIGLCVPVAAGLIAGGISGFSYSACQVFGIFREPNQNIQEQAIPFESPLAAP